MLTCSIAIATRTRRDDLERTLSVLRSLDPHPLEILVCLDGCLDNSLEMIQQNFPNVAVIQNETSLGSVPSRDRLFRMARGDIVISLDDDSYPLQADFIERVVILANAHPEACGFTFVEIGNDGQSPDPLTSVSSPGKYVSAFPNCAAAIRRSVYGETCVFPTFFQHMYEEPDFCIQAYAAGFGVWFEPTIHIRHHSSPVGRNLHRRQAQNARNEFWSVILRCPLPHSLWMAPYRALRQFAFASSQGWRWIVEQPVWWWAALTGLPRCLEQRRPVPWPVYWNWLMLSRRPIASRPDLAKAFVTVEARLQSTPERACNTSSSDCS